MDIKETGKKLKPFAPVLSVALVTACVAGSLSGYEAPVYAATQEETPIKKRQKRRKKKKRQQPKVRLIWRMAYIKEPEPGMQETLPYRYRSRISRLFRLTF